MKQNKVLLTDVCSFLLANVCLGPEQALAVDAIGSRKVYLQFFLLGALVVVVFVGDVAAFGTELAEKHKDLSYLFLLSFGEGV